MNKIGRNALCPCGSGKKHKYCCINKKALNTSFNYSNKEINNILSSIYYFDERMPIKEKIDKYLIVIDYLVSYAVKHNIKNLSELDFIVIEDFATNVITNLEDEILNLQVADYDLNLVIKCLDQLLTTFKLDELLYENLIRAKCLMLFRSKNIEAGEKLILDYLKDNPTAGFVYVELVDDFTIVGDLDKAKYYYDKGMSIKDLKDKDVLAERYYQLISKKES